MQRVSRTKNSVGTKLCEQKSGGNRLYEQNEFHEEKNLCTSFQNRKINMKKFCERETLHNNFHKQK